MPYLGNTPDTVTKVDYYYTAANNQTVFTGADNYGVIMSLNPGFTDVYLNGVLLNLDEYTANSTHVTIAQALDVGDVVQVRGLGVTAISNTVYNYSSVNFKNKIINGDFDFWQRAVSNTFTSNYGYVSDRWFVQTNGSTTVCSRSAFTAGQTDVPYEPTFYATYTTSSVAAAGSYVITYQPVEDVRTTANKVMTLSFYAKANSTANLSIDYYQYFGSGGSTTVYSGTKRFTLSTTWQKFTHTHVMPSISGKTITTNHGSAAVFWLDAGSTYNSRTDSMGQQSRIIDIAQVQWEEGYKDTPFEVRPYTVELALCQRYFTKSYNTDLIPTAANSAFSIFATAMPSATTRYTTNHPFPVTMRASPAVTFYPGRTDVPFTAGNVSTYNGITSHTPSTYAYANAMGIRGFFAIASAVDAISYNFTADAEL